MGHKWNTCWTWGFYQLLVFNYWRSLAIIAHINVFVRYKIREKLKDFRAVSKAIKRRPYIERGNKEISREDRILRTDWEAEERHFKPCQIWQFKGSIDKVKIEGLLKLLTCKIIIASDDMYGLAWISIIDKIR